MKDGKEYSGGDGVPNSGVAPPKEYYTNQMLYDLLKPDGMSTPYVYDHFQWPHCDVSRQYIARAQKKLRWKYIVESAPPPVITRTRGLVVVWVDLLGGVASLRGWQGRKHRNKLD